MILDILRCVCGFLFQILPCAFFCLYPFRNDFRYPQKKMLFALAGLLTVMTIAFTWTYIKLQRQAAGNINYLPLAVIFLTTVILSLLMYKFCIDARPIHKLFVFLMTMNYEFFVTEVASYLIGLLFGGCEDYLYSPENLIICLLLNGILFRPMLGLMRFMEKMVEQERILAEEQLRLMAMVDNYRSMADSAEKVREARHEIMHHITALSMLIKNKDYIGAENYLDKISRVTHAIPAPPYTPHSLLNSILSDYKKRAEDTHIQVTYQIFVQSSLSMDDSDLCQLVANLLDNSLEGCAHVESEKRTIQLTIRQKGNFLFLSCENSCDPDQIKCINGKPVSTKDSPDRKAHGFGIPIMERIAKKYNGALRASINGNYFTVDINMCFT